MNLAIFWKDSISEPERRLVEAMEVAHGLASFRDNPSSVAVNLAGAGSRSYTQAIAAALMTLGGPHAPLLDTWKLLAADDPAAEATEILKRGDKVPGWGSSFAEDKTWEPVAMILRADFPQLAEKIDRVTGELRKAQKLIIPNPSAYTAAVAIALSMPAECLPYLFIASRLAAWSVIFQSTIK